MLVVLWTLKAPTHLYRADLSKELCITDGTLRAGSQRAVTVFFRFDLRARTNQFLAKLKWFCQEEEGTEENL